MKKFSVLEKIRDFFQPVLQLLVASNYLQPNVLQELLASSFLYYEVGHKKRSLASLYDRTRRLYDTHSYKKDQNDLRTGTRAEFRPFVEALV